MIRLVTVQYLTHNGYSKNCGSYFDSDSDYYYYFSHFTIKEKVHG